VIKSIAATHPGPTPEPAITVGLTGIDLALWTCLMAGLLLARVAPAFGPALSPDSFQYLSAAANFLHGAPGHTSLVHYDVERSFGVVPAPMVTFALGYPILIASLGLLGASLPLAAWIVSAASTVAAVPVLASMARRLGLSRGLCHAVIGAFVVNGAVVEFGDSALSEAPFALCVLLGAALLLQAGDATGRRARLRWAGAGAAFAAAYTIRYAGLFFIVGLAVLTLRHALTRHPMRARGHAIALGVSLVPVVVVIARNFALVGN